MHEKPSFATLGLFVLLSGGIAMNASNATPPAPVPAPSPSQSPRAAAKPASPVNDDDDVITVSTDLVQFPIRVVNREGRTLGDLTKEDVTLTVDGNAQTIEHLGKDNSPFIVTMLVDVSNSIAPYLGSSIIPTSKAFANLLNERDRMQIIQFAGTPTPMLRRFTPGTPEGKRLIQEQLEKLALQDATSFFDAVGAGIASFPVRSFLQNKALIILSDGEDTSSSRFMLPGILKALEETQISVYSIDATGGNPNLQQIAEASNGKWYSLRDFADAGKMGRILNEIERELRLKQLASFYFVDEKTGNSLSKKVAHPVVFRLTATGRKRYPDGVLVYPGKICLMESCQQNLLATLQSMGSTGAPTATERFQEAKVALVGLRNDLQSLVPLTSGSFRLARDLSIGAEGVNLLAGDKAGKLLIEPASNALTIAEMGKLACFVQGVDATDSPVPLTLKKGTPLTISASYKPAYEIFDLRPGKTDKLEQFFASGVTWVFEAQDANKSWIHMECRWPVAKLQSDSVSSELLPFLKPFVSSGK